MPLVAAIPATCTAKAATGEGEYLATGDRARIDGDWVTVVAPKA